MKILPRRCLSFAVAALLLPASLTAGEPSVPAVAPDRGKEVLVVKDSRDAQTFDAVGQDVTVNGSHNKITIKGTCHALTISGDANAVTVEGVSSIAVTGEGNEVVWSRASDGEKPQVTDLGRSNKVVRAGTKAD